MNSSGAFTAKRIFAGLVNGTLTQEEARTLYDRVYTDQRIIAGLLADAELERVRQRREKCAKGIRRRYFTGEIDRPTAVQLLVSQGYDEITAISLTESWTCERDSRSKEPTVDFLRRWYWRGYITVEQLFNRLVRLGYEAFDASRIIRLAQEEEAERRAKEEAQRLEKLRKDRERLANQQRREAERLRKLAGNPPRP
jgi:hypothetical protein